MKLVYLIQYFYPEKSSGLHLVEDLLEGFSKQGWNIELFTPTPTRGVTSEERKEYSKKRVEIKYDGKLIIHRIHLFREGKGVIARAIRYILFSIECFWKAVTVPADFIFTGSGPPTQGFVVGLAKLVSGKKVIYNLQDIFPDSLVTSGICERNSFLMRIGHAMENFTYYHADHIITITNDMKANIMRKGVPEEKITVIRNWVDTDKVKYILREDNMLFDKFNLSRNKFYVLYAGNLGKVQGVDVILEAAKHIKKYKEINFIIFGNGSEEEKLREIKNINNLDNLYIFDLQHNKYVSEVYSMADISVIPCKPGTGGSGMPSKTWTIMAAGIPIIAMFDRPSEMERTIKEAECGICIDPGDAKLLSDSILNLYNNRLTLAKMSNNSRKYVEAKASKRSAVAQYLKTISAKVEK